MKTREELIQLYTEQRGQLAAKLDAFLLKAGGWDQKKDGPGYNADQLLTEIALLDGKINVLTK